MDQHMEMLKNKNVSERLANELKRFETEEEPILFAVIGDLSLNCSYCETMLAITKNRTIVIDSSLEGGAAVYPHADVEKAAVKRMYGNAVLKYTVNGKALSVFRFTYSVAALCDTAAVFVEHMHDGADLARLRLHRHHRRGLPPLRQDASARRGGVHSLPIQKENGGKAL